MLEKKKIICKNNEPYLLSEHCLELPAAIYDTESDKIIYIGELSKIPPVFITEHTRVMEFVKHPDEQTIGASYAENTKIYIRSLTNQEISRILDTLLNGDKTEINQILAAIGTYDGKPKDAILQQILKEKTE